MDNRENYAKEAQALFRCFAARHTLVIEEVDTGAAMDLCMVLPVQNGLSFELTLGLQNHDEVNIGFEAFWSYFFPFPHVAQEVGEILDDLIAGRCRMATYRQFGIVLRRTLECQRQDQWVVIYAAIQLRLQIPFVPVQVTYLVNTPETVGIGK